MESLRGKNSMKMQLYLNKPIVAVISAFIEGDFRKDILGTKKRRYMQSSKWNLLFDVVLVIDKLIA